MLEELKEDVISFSQQVRRDVLLLVLPQLVSGH